FWDERFEKMAKQYPEVDTSQFHVDAMTIKLVLNPQQFDEIVASNLFGDILSDLGPATAGTIGIAPSANINPDRKYPSLFEPVHWSAPGIAGQGLANPIGQSRSGALMLDHVRDIDAAQAGQEVMEHTLQRSPRTPDL